VLEDTFELCPSSVRVGFLEFSILSPEILCLNGKIKNEEKSIPASVALDGVFQVKTDI